MNDEILSRRLADGGPYYRETDLSHWIAEPWNAFTSLLFIIAATLFFLKIKKDLRANVFLTFAIPVLIIGGIGGTLYHAFRCSALFLALDVVPIYLLIFGSAAWLWFRISGKLWIVEFIIIFFLASDSIIFYGFGLKENVRQSAAYGNMGITIMFPLVWTLIREKFAAGGWAVASILMYGIGLAFRVMDAFEPAIFPMGTHFLWHICCATGSFLFGNYIYKLGK